jgi:predicted O-methyltransferase YrrM
MFFGGIPKKLIAELSRAFELTYFVETGTHHGWSALWASDHFQNVWTVELDEAHYHRAKRRLSGRANVEQHLGPSVNMLRSVDSSRGRSVHWR